MGNAIKFCARSRSQSKHFFDSTPGFTAILGNAHLDQNDILYLNALNYAVVWRVINSADDGMPQRRRRVFILAYHKSTGIYKELIAKKNKLNWLESESVIARELPVKPLANKPISGTINADIQVVSDAFNSEGAKSPFMNTGVLLNGEFITVKTESNYQGKHTVLEDILVESKKIPSEFFIDESALKDKKG